MFNFNCHFILILTVCTTTACDKETCDVTDKSVKALCKVIEKTFPQDDGKFSTHFCSCITANIKSQPALCNTKDYDFAVAPECGKLLKSKEFEEVCSKENLLDDYLINVLFKKEFKVCTESEDNVVEAARAIYQPGYVSDTLGFIKGHMLEAKLAELFANCHKELLKMAAQPED